MAVATDAIDSFLEQTGSNDAPPENIPPLLQRPPEETDPSTLPVADEATTQEALKNLEQTKQAVSIATAPLAADWAHSSIVPIRPKPEPDTSEIDKFLDDSEPAETTEEARKTLADPNIAPYLDWDARVALSHLARGQDAPSNLADAAKAIGGWWMHAHHPAYWGELGREITNKFVKPAAKTTTSAIENVGRLGRGPNEPPQDGEQMALGAGKEALNIGSGVGDFLMRAPGTITDLIGGIANVADPRDSDHVDAVRSIINDAAQYGVNAKNELVKMTGGEPESPESKVAEFLPWLAVPGGAEEAASPLIAKGVNAAVEGALPAIGKGIEMGAKAAKAAAVPVAVGADLYASGGSLSGMASAFMTLLTKYGGENIPVLGKIKHFALEAPFDMLAKGGNILSKTGDGVTVFDAMGDALEQEISRQTQRLEKMKAKNPSAAEEAFDSDPINGGRLNKSEELSGPAKQMRQVEEKIASNTARKAFVDKYKNVWSIFSSLTKYGIKTAAQADLGAATSGAVMAGLSGTSAPPGQEVPAATEGFKLGVALGGPGAALGAPEAVDQAKLGRSGKILSGAARAVLEGHPYGRTDAVTSLPGDMQDVVRKYQGLADLSGSKPLLVLKPDDLKKSLKEVEGKDVAVAPNGYVGKDVIYANADTLADGNIPHEMMHGTGLDKDPNVVATVQDAMEAHPDKFQKGLDKYNEDLLHTSPNATPLTLNSSPKEIIAALGADILRDIPPEALFGGRSGGPLISKWFNDKFGKKGIGYTSQYGFLVTPEMKSALTDALFDLGQKAARNRPRGPVMTATPEDIKLTADAIQSAEDIQNAADAIQVLGYKAKDALEMAKAAAAEGAVTPQEIARKALQKKARGNVVPINPEPVAKPVADKPGMPDLKKEKVQPGEFNQKGYTAIPSVDEKETAGSVSKIPAVSVAEPPAAGVSAKGPGEAAASVPSGEEIQGAIAAANQKAGPKMERAKGGKKQTVEERRAEIGREHRLEALQALLPNEGPGLHVVVDDMTGHKSYKGQIDFDNPLHKAFINEFGYNAEHKANLEALQDNIGKGVYLRRYQGAGQEGFEEGGADLSAQARREEYKASPTGKAGEGRDGPITEQDKAVTPLGIIQTKKGVLARVFDHGPFLGNLRAVIDAAHAAGLKTGYEGLHGEELDHEVAADVRTVAYNHSIGHSGDGSKELHLLPDSEPVTREGKPQPVDSDRAAVINMAFANESAKKPELPKPDKEGKVSEARQNQYLKALDASEQALGLADLNKGYNNKGETNKLRDDLVQQGFDPGTLKPTVVSIRPDYIEGGVHPTPATEADRVHAHGFDIPANELTKEGLPRHDFSAGGFMPAKKGIPEVSDERDPQTKTPEFKRWFSGSKVADDQGNPVPLYHGTTHNFSAFDPSRHNVEGDFGQGIYLSNTPEDVAANYAGMGPDLTNRVGQAKDRLESYLSGAPNTPEQVQSVMADWGVSKKIAQRLLKGDFPDDLMNKVARDHVAGEHEGATMKVYADLKNPLELGGEKEPYWDYSHDEETGQESGSLIDLHSALQRVSREFNDIDPSKAFTQAIDEVGYDGKASDYITSLKNSEGLMYATNDAGDLVSGEAIRRVIEEMGYDGIIDRMIDRKFGTQNKARDKGMEGVTPDTFHVIAFKPEQIKSAIGNRGTFDPKNPDITMMPARSQPGPNADSEPWVHRYFELLKKEYPDGGLAPTGKLTDKEELEMDQLHQQAEKEFGSYDAFMKAHGQKTYGSFDKFHQANSAPSPNEERTGGDMMPAGRVIAWLDKNGNLIEGRDHQPMADRVTGKEGDASFEEMFNRKHARIVIDNGTLFYNTALTGSGSDLTKAQRQKIEDLASSRGLATINADTNKLVQSLTFPNRSGIRREIPWGIGMEFMPAGKHALIPDIPAHSTSRIPSLVGTQKRRGD